MPVIDSFPRLVTALILAAACAVSACDRSAPRTDPVEAADSGGVAVVAELADLERPMPLVDQTSFDADLVDLLYMGLTRGAWREGRLVSQLADENPMAMALGWRWDNADSTAIRFSLRSGLRWSDGQPITAADVAWSYRMVKDTLVASARIDGVTLIDSVRADGDSAVTVFFARRSPDMWTQTQLPIAPRHVYGDGAPAALSSHPALADPARMVVSGPFRIARHRPGERIDLVPNPHFPVRPRLDGIVFRIIPEPTTRVTELQTGQVDLVRPVTAEQAAALRTRMPGVKLYQEPGKFWEFVAYNPRTVEAFRDVEVRRALSLALDVPGIIRALGMESFATPAGGPYGPVFGPLHDARTAPPMRQDTAGARRLLEERGWRDADGDGIREREGVPLRFTLVTNSGNARRRDAAQLIQRQWRNVGADVRLEQLETGTFNEQLLGREYQAALAGWSVALDPDLGPVFGRDGFVNIVSFDDPEVDRLMSQARAQSTAEQAAPLWRAVAQRIVQAHPYAWLYYYDGITAGAERLHGVRIDTYGAYQNTWEWWIPADRRLPRDRVAAE